MKKNKTNVEKIFDEEIITPNIKSIHFYESYKQASDIFYRTYIALGRKKIYVSSTSSTSQVSIDTNAIKTTN